MGKRGHYLNVVASKINKVTVHIAKTQIAELVEKHEDNVCELATLLNSGVLTSQDEGDYRGVSFGRNCDCIQLLPFCFIILFSLGFLAMAPMRS